MPKDKNIYTDPKNEDLRIRAAKGMAGQLEEPPTVKALRERIYTQAQEIDSLRTLCAVLYTGPALDTDEGELQDKREHPFINFRTDSPETIRQKIIERADKHNQSSN